MDQHLISVDELRAAGALDVPANWRKTLGSNRDAECPLFSGLLDEDDSSDSEIQSDPSDFESGKA